MFFSQPLPFVTTFIDELNNAIKEFKPKAALSRKQKAWLAFCVMGIIITNSVCWAKFERAGLTKYSMAALSWMFRNSKIPWNLLLQMSVMVILRTYGITEGVIAIDDSDKKRSKSTKTIAWVHKIKDKPSGGYIMGQQFVVLVLIAQNITFPIGFSFYMPDPELSTWNKKNKQLKKIGIPAKQRPLKPSKNKNYPTIPEITLQLLEQFKIYHPNIKIKCILADALYGTKKFLDGASKIFGNVQVVSQLRSNQNILFKNKKLSVEEYFLKYPGTEQKIRIRGGEIVTVNFGSARLFVNAHCKKRFVIALKYEGETEYRYIVASDMSWRTLDIVQAYTLRWLVEVFFQDWKANEGWGKLTKQPGEEGSSRSLILSLLVDHCLFLHPDQLALLENKLLANTVGSLKNKIKVESTLHFIKDILSSDNPEESLKVISKMLEENVVDLRPSTKHMVNRDLGRLEPTPSLKYKIA
jgi:hypothetical protein